MAKPNRKQQQPTEQSEHIEQIEQPAGSEVLEALGASPELVEAMAKVEAEAQQSPEYFIAKFGNKSNAIRALNSEGKTRSEIAKLLGIRYQHVNNVLNQVLKRPIKAEREAEKLASIEDRGPEGDEMSQEELDAQ